MGVQVSGGGSATRLGPFGVPTSANGWLVVSSPSLFGALLFLKHQVAREIAQFKRWSYFYGPMTVRLIYERNC